MAIEHDVRVDLVHTDHHVVRQAQLADAQQLFAGEAAAGGVLGVAHEHDLYAGILQLGFQVLEVDLVAAIDQLHLVVNQLTAVVLHQIMEGRIYRGLQQDLVALAGEFLGKPDHGGNYTGRVVDVLGDQIGIVANLVPAGDALLERHIDVGIAVVAQLGALDQGFLHLNGAGELGVRDPERQHIRRAQVGVELLGVGASSLHALVEIINHVAHNGTPFDL